MGRVSLHKCSRTSAVIFTVAFNPLCVIGDPLLLGVAKGLAVTADKEMKDVNEIGVAARMPLMVMLDWYLSVY